MTEKKCIICEEKTNDWISGCGHDVCKDCLGQHSKVAIDDGFCSIRCPQRDCRNILPYRLISDCVSEQSISKLDKLITREALIDEEKNRIRCRVCSNRCTYSEEKFFCNECCKYYCSQCYEEEHEFDQDCEHTQINDFLENEHSNFKRCPRCRIIIEKTQGCDCIRCPSCKCKFCWNCLLRYKWMESVDSHREICKEFRGFNQDDNSDASESENGSDH